VVLTLAIGVNSALFSQNNSGQRSIAGEPRAVNSRSIASINPIFKVSWEKKAFEVLENSESRDLANVGQNPSVFDSFAFGTLEGYYSVRKIDGKISEILFSEGSGSKPMAFLKRQNFLIQNLALFSAEAKKVEQVHVESNDERVIERFQLTGAQGQALGTVQVLLDQNQNLLSMTVQ